MQTVLLLQQGLERVQRRLSLVRRDLEQEVIDVEITFDVDSSYPTVMYENSPIFEHTHTVTHTHTHTHTNTHTHTHTQCHTHTHTHQ